MLIFNYGFWEFWQNYPQKVTFDGVNKLILVNYGVTQLDVGIDIYSGWKEWVRYRDNTKYPMAISAIGGDPTVAGQRLGATYFLENGWKIRTWEGDHRLVVTGNIYSRDGLDPFVPTINPHNITITMQVSNLIDQVSTSGGATTVDYAQVASSVWNHANRTLTNMDVVTIASSVWAHASRTLTGNVSLSPQDEQAIADAVWSATVRTLTSIQAQTKGKAVV